MNNKRIEVKICTGTTCYILGGSKYLRLSDNLNPEILAKVEIKGAPCMGYCHDKETKHKLPCITIDGTTYHGLSLEEAVATINEAVTEGAALAVS